MAGLGCLAGAEFGLYLVASDEPGAPLSALFGIDEDDLLELGEERLLFTGDLGRQNDLLMKPPTPLDHADVVLTESTYGNRLHPREDIAGVLAEMLAGRTGLFHFGDAQLSEDSGRKFAALLKEKRALRETP